MSLSAAGATLRRIPGIAWVILLAVLFLLAGAVGVYRAGVARGRGELVVAHADAARRTAGAAVIVALERQHAADDEAARAASGRDSTARVARVRAAARAVTRARLDTARAGFTLVGDTAALAGDSVRVALPAPVAEAIRLQDVTNAATDSLEAARAIVDAATSALLDANDRQLAARDTAIGALRGQLAADTVVIDALRAQRAPRVGFRTGVAVGTTATLGVVWLVLQVLR